MDFKTVFIELITSLLIIIRRIILLIFYPYKTMRDIALNGKSYQTIIILVIALLYFLFSYSLRGSPWWGGVVYIVFLLTFITTVTFFYHLSKQFKKDIRFRSFIYTFSYTLIPTLFWFISNLALFIILPPPRTMSILGRGFSIFFIAYSVSLLVWKLILVYLAIRFSSRLGLYRIIYMFLLYTIIFVPLSLLLYYFKIFRIPFI
ncbi:hypothetical protein HZC27_01880 [Candidatus Roizmanbacteria bacterium]|nr:hypothetical protein [Candidatus Roizmanbacteria bacterium]